jgi:hypothetical protein
MTEPRGVSPAASPRPSQQALGWALVGYGITGLLLFGLIMAIVVRPLVGLETLFDQRAGVVQFLDVTVQTLDDAGRGSGNAGTTLTAAAKAAANAAALSDQLAGSMTALGSASGVSILGSQPLSGLSGQFEAVAGQAHELSGTMGSLAATLDQNTVDFTTLTTDIAAVREQVAALRTTLLATKGLDSVVQWLAPLSVLVSIWMVIPALASLGIGIRLVRRTRSQLTAEP